MVSSGQGDVGAAKLTGEVLNIVTKVPELVKTMTGVDIVKVCYFETCMWAYIIFGVFFSPFTLDRAWVSTGVTTNLIFRALAVE